MLASTLALAYISQKKNGSQSYFIPKTALKKSAATVGSATGFNLADFFCQMPFLASTGICSFLSNRINRLYKGASKKMDIFWLIFSM